MADPEDAASAPRRALTEFVRRVGGTDARADLDAVAADVLGAFAAAGVEVLLLKGPVLERVLYAPGETRAYSDVDIMVAPGALAAAGRELSRLGFVNVSEQLGIVDVGGVLHAETWAGTGDRVKAGLMIDLHWRLAGTRASPQVVWEELTAQSASVDLGGWHAPALAPPGLALHLAIHAAQHGARQPRALEDLVRGLERWPPGVWRDALRIAGRVQGVEYFAAGLRMVAAGAKLADELELPPTDELLWTILNRADRPRGTFHLRAFAEAATLSRRVELLRRSLLPTRDWILRRHPWASGGRLRLLAAYAMHIAGAPGWAVRAWRFERRARRARG
jgi:hypothetical protein